MTSLPVFSQTFGYPTLGGHRKNYDTLDYLLKIGAKIQGGLTSLLLESPKPFHVF